MTNYHEFFRKFQYFGAVSHFSRESLKWDFCPHFEKLVPNWLSLLPDGSWCVCWEDAIWCCLVLSEHGYTASSQEVPADYAQQETMFTAFEIINSVIYLQYSSKVTTKQNQSGIGYIQTQSHLEHPELFLILFPKIWLFQVLCLSSFCTAKVVMDYS